MTAPYKRPDTDDDLGTNRRRLKALEATRSQPDALVFGWAYNVFNGGADIVVSVGGTDPTGISAYAVGYVTDNLVANCMVSLSTIGGFTVGTGSQYLIPVGQSSLWEPSPGIFEYVYQPSSYSIVNQVLGVVTAQDTTGSGLYTNMNARISGIDYLGDGSPFLEFYDPITGSLWGPAFPYSWASGDLLLSGSFVYTLYLSLIDTIGT